MNRILLLLLCCVGMIGCDNSSSSQATQEQESQLVKISIVLNWFPEAEHGGFYAAKVHGIFKKYGLEANIIAGGPGVQVTQKVLSGRAGFGVTNADQVLYAQEQKIPLVALMAPIQNSPRCIMVHEQTGIKTLQQLQDVTLAINQERAFAKYLLKKVPLPNVQLERYSGNITRFLLSKKYAQQAYVFSEPILAQMKGAQPRNLMVSEIGFNPYTSALVTTADYIKQNRDIVKRVVKACVKGWETYLANPAATNSYIHKLNPEMEMVVLQAGVKALKALDETSESPSSVPVGSMELKRWQELYQQMKEVGALAKDISIEKVFTLEFLPNKS